MSIQSIVPLTTMRWELARQNAETTIRGRITEPRRIMYGSEENKHPSWLIALVVVLLMVVALAAFFISAGREIAVVNQGLVSLVATFPILTDSHVNIGTLAVLALTEAGALLFGYASRVLSDDRRIQIAFRLFQLACVSVALIANITITGEHPMLSAPVFDWALTIIPPLLVIGLGMILEEMTANWLRARYISTTAYNQAIRQYREQCAAPDKHPDFLNVWAQCILEQLIQQSKHNKELIPTIIDAEPRARQVIVAMQFRRFEWTYDPDAELPELTSGVPVSSVTDVSLAKKKPQKYSPEIQRVIDWWYANPDEKKPDQRTIAKRIGVSVATVNRALKLIGTIETDGNTEKQDEPNEVQP